MFRQEQGSCADDPLFRMLALDGEAAEAMAYANTHNAGHIQHELRVDTEDSSWDDPDSDSHIIQTELTHVDDVLVAQLINAKEVHMASVKRTRTKMDKQMANTGKVKSHMPDVIPSTQVKKPIDADVAALIAKRSKK